MANEESYSRIGGVATKGEAYRLLMHHLDACITQCQVIGHFYNTEDDNMAKLLAKGWYGCAEMFIMTKEQIRQLATRGLQ